MTITAPHIIFGTLLLLPMPAFLSSEMQFRFSLGCMALLFLYLGLKNGLRIRLAELLFFLSIPLILGMAHFKSAALLGESEIILELLRVLINVSFLVFFLGYYRRYRLVNPDVERHIVSVCYFFLITQSIILLLNYSPASLILDTVYNTEKATLASNFSQKLRVTGSLENPNYIAYLACLLYSLVAPSARSIGFSSTIMMMAFFAITIASGSKTGLLVFVLQSLLYFPRLIVPLLFFGGGFLIQALTSIERFRKLFDGGEASIAAVIASESMQYRLATLYEVAPIIMDNLWIGSGYSLVGVIDNLYLKNFVRFGLVGAILYGACAIWIILKMRSRKSKFLIGFAVTPLLFNLTGAFLDNFRLLAMTMLLATLFYYRLVSEKGVVFSDEKSSNSYRK